MVASIRHLAGARADLSRGRGSLLPHIHHFEREENASLRGIARFPSLRAVVLRTAQGLAGERAASCSRTCKKSSYSSHTFPPLLPRVRSPINNLGLTSEVVIHRPVAMERSRSRSETSFGQAWLVLSLPSPYPFWLSGVPPTRYPFKVEIAR